MRHDPLPSSPPSHRRPTWWAVAIIVSTISIAWSNSLVAPFVFDDVHSVTDNPSLRDFWALGWLVPPASIGETVGGRPFLNFTFALNYAVGGLDVRGYHLVNLFIHQLAALTVFGIIHCLARIYTGLDAARGWLLALATALLWALHPLQTGAVTYISQRAESLAGLFCLVTFYAFVRSVHSPRPLRWRFVAAAAAGLGVLTKETAVVAPLLVLLYDVKFASGTLRKAWKQHRGLYVAFVVVWVVLGVQVWSNSSRGGSAGFVSEVPVWTYLLTQSRAIFYYLTKVVWPCDLIFDHGTPVAAGLRDVWGFMLVIALLLGASVAAGVRGRWWGFVGVTFFLLLAPSSSIVPVSTQTIGEHRMYLPLIAPVFGVAWLLVVRLPSRRVIVPTLGTAAIAVALASVTFARNAVYRTASGLWSDTAAKAPENSRAFNNLGLAWVEAGEKEKAMQAFSHAIELRPNHAFARYNLARTFLQKSQYKEALVEFRAALSADAHQPSAHLGIGLALAELGDKEGAMHHFQEALNLDPGLIDARINLAALYRERGKLREALVQLSDAATVSPGSADVVFQMGLTYDRMGDKRSSLQRLREAASLRADWPEARLALGNVQLGLGLSAEAEASYRDAVRLRPEWGEARFALGSALAAREAFDAAIVELRKALQYSPDHGQARANLGNCFLITGRIGEAIVEYEMVLRRDPGNETVKENLKLAREIQRSGPPDRVR